MGKASNRLSDKAPVRAAWQVLDHDGEHSSGWGVLDRGQNQLHGADAERMDQEGEVYTGVPAGVPTDTAERLKALERENRQLRRTNEILRKASAYFVQAELDRPLKR